MDQTSLSVPVATRFHTAVPRSRHQRRRLPLTAAVTAANTADAPMFAAVLDVPLIRTPSGRRRRRPATVDAVHGASGLHGEDVDPLPRRVAVEVELTRKTAARLREAWTRPRVFSGKAEALTSYMVMTTFPWACPSPR